MSYAQSSGASHAATAARALTTDWIDLGPLDDLPEGRPALRTGKGGGVAVPLAAVRRGARVDVFIGTCSHLSGPLYEGTVETGARARTAWSARCTARRSTWTAAPPRRGPAANAQEKLEVRMEAGRVMARLRRPRTSEVSGGKEAGPAAPGGTGRPGRGRSRPAHRSAGRTIRGRTAGDVAGRPTGAS